MAWYGAEGFGSGGILFAALFWGISLQRHGGNFWLCVTSRHLCDGWGVGVTAPNNPLSC